MSPRTDTRGPLVNAALAAPLEPGEKRRILIGLAMLLEERPGGDVSIGELRRTTHLHRMNLVMKLDRLAALGLIAIERGDDATEQRSRYRLLLPDLPDPPTHTKEKNMAPATTTPVLPMTPPGFESGWLKPLQSIEWTDYEQIRERHEQAVAALVAAAGDRPAEIEALRAVAEIVEQAARVLPPEVAEGGEGYAALEKKREELQPPPASDQHPLAQGMSMEQARQNADTVGAIRALDGADKRQQILDFREDFYWLSEVGWGGSGSKLSSAAGGVGEVRRRCSEAAAE